MLGAADVIVFLARPGVADPDRIAAARALLSPADHAHVDRHRFAHDRELALASRALQRRALSACVPDVPPAAWQFVAERDGRPVIEAPRIAPGLRFSVANTRGLVGCAVTLDRDVGLDLEPWRDDAPPELVARCFTPTERAALHALPAPAQPRRFIELWTVKEAYLKARGIGLEPPLDHIDVALDDGAPRLALDPALGDDPARWQLALWAPTPEHAAAVCVDRGAGAPLTIHRRWDPA